MDGIILLGRKSCIREIKIKMYWVPKSIPAVQNLKILSTFQGYKNPHGQNFWNLIFLLSEKARLDRYYENKN